MIETFNLCIVNTNRFCIVVGGDHGQGVFRFPIKLIYIYIYIYIMDDGNIFERISYVVYGK